jgi:Fur family transcriptional regulator, zinc uptake regulator
VADNKIKQIIHSMVSNGLRVTEQRKSLAKLFAEASGYVSPKEVYDSLEAKYKGLSFDTVYRNLRVLFDMGVLEQFHTEDGVKFRMGCYSHDQHHHHLICLNCDQIYPLDFCPMNFIGDIPDQFKVVKHKFEIYGYCFVCAKVEELASGKDDSTLIN